MYFLLRNGDIPASYVSLPEGRWLAMHRKNGCRPCAWSLIQIASMQRRSKSALGIIWTSVLPQKEHLYEASFSPCTLPPIIMEVKKWVPPIVVTFQIWPFSTSMIMGERVYHVTSRVYIYILLFKSPFIRSCCGFSLRLDSG